MIRSHLENGTLTPLLFIRVISSRHWTPSKELQHPLAFVIARATVFLSLTTPRDLVTIDRGRSFRCCQRIEIIHVTRRSQFCTASCCKVCSRERNRVRVREAWFYDELQSLGGKMRVTRLKYLRTALLSCVISAQKINPPRI